MASNLATFKGLLAAHVESGKPVPSVILKDDNELGQAFNRVVTKEQTVEGETVGQTAGRYVDEICASLGDEQNAEACRIFGETVELFTTKMKNAWNNVSGIRDTGKELAQQMDKIANDQMTQNEFVSTHMNYSQLSTDFPVFDWNGTKVMGSINDVIRTVNSFATREGEPSDQINNGLFNIIISDMTKFGQVQDVPMTEETRNAAIDCLISVCQSSTAGDIEIVVDAITGINKNCPIHARLCKLRDLASIQGQLFDTIKLFDSAISSMFPILELITSGQVAPVPTSKETIIANANEIIKVLQLACYYEYMQRTSVFKDALLLQGGLVNADCQEAFKTAGGTSQMLAEFVRFMYNDDKTKIAVTGVKGQAILDGASAVSEKVKKDIANVESRVALARNTARMSAYRIVMRDYLSKKIRRENQDIPGTEAATKVEELMKSAVVPITESIRQYNANFIDAAMNAIVASEYPKTFTEHLFKELGAAYISATEQNGNITAADLRQVDVAVIAKMITTFLADFLVIQVPEGTDAPVVSA